MAKMIVIDQKACTGCRQCELVCSVKHTGTADPSRSRIHVIKWEAEGFYLPSTCQQCIEAACAVVCPKNALTRVRAEDRVVLDYDLCIGCKMCVMACPFGAMGIDTKEDRVIKCDHCGGDPTCVKFCEAGALRYEDTATANLSKKRAHGARLSQLMKAHA